MPGQGQHYWQAFAAAETAACHGVGQLLRVDSQLDVDVRGEGAVCGQLVCDLSRRFRRQSLGLVGRRQLLQLGFWLRALRRAL